MPTRDPVWIAVYVKPRHEKAVASILSGKGFGAFVPLFVRRHESGKRAELPLFPSYVFCRMQPLSSLPVLMTPGVFSVVSSGGTPVPIPDEEINRIKTFVDAGLSPRPWPYIASGMHILIASGPLKGITGIVSEMSNEKWLVVSVSLLKQSVAVKIARDEFSIQPC